MKRFFTLLLTLVSVAAHAQLTMPRFFSDNMVLQQQSNVALWGTDSPNQKISIQSSWGEKTSAVADANGAWRCEIATFEADNQPQILTIKGSETKKIQNIMFGEVWFCSGQSNMNMKVLDSRANRQNVIGSNETVLTSCNASIRYFDTPQVTSDVAMSDLPEGEWSVASPATVGSYSATAYYFARRLNEVMDIPVGIIHSSWGGTPIEPWMNLASLESFENYSYKKLYSNAKGHQLRPSYLFNAMVSPFIGYNIKGFLWYQGERNRAQYQEYAELLPAMIKLWRDEWGLGDLSFYYVQIAPYNEPGAKAFNGAFIRDVQRTTMEVIDGVGMVSIVDIGEADNIHPAEKRTVGERLALWAFAKDYGYETIGYSGPNYKSMKVGANGHVIVSFDHSLNMTTYGKELTGFEVAGADRVFHPAQAVLINKSSQVELYSDAVAEPVAVRYCFKKWAVGSLYNAYDLPASSFRTDDWDSVGTYE